jgi:cell division protein FtsW
MTVELHAQALPDDADPLLPALDYRLIASAVTLLCLGLVMVASCTLHRYESAPFYFTLRHTFALLAGLIAALVVYQIPIRLWRPLGGLLYLAGLVLLVLVMVPGLGTEVNGATRWIRVAGISLQTSEFMKLFLIIYVAGYLVRHQGEMIDSVWAFIKPILLLTLASALIMWQPDFGTVGVLVATTLGMLFLGGVSLLYFGVLLGLAGSALAALIYVSPYRMERITSFTDPWADVNDSGYQLAQALIAFGRGEWTGVGLGNGIQKQFYLPEAHTDFIMAVIGEELGLVGSLLVIGLFAFIVWRAFDIAAVAQKNGNFFAGWLAQGLGLWLGIQAVVNIGVNMGVLPTKGLTLPLMSYGGNSILVACMAIAILVRIDAENRRHIPDGPREDKTWAA